MSSTPEQWDSNGNGERQTAVEMGFKPEFCGGCKRAVWWDAHMKRNVNYHGGKHVCAPLLRREVEKVEEYVRGKNIRFLQKIGETIPQAAHRIRATSSKDLVGDLEEAILAEVTRLKRESRKAIDPAKEVRVSTRAAFSKAPGNKKSYVEVSPPNEYIQIVLHNESVCIPVDKMVRASDLVALATSPLNWIKTGLSIDDICSAIYQKLPRINGDFGHELRESLLDAGYDGWKIPGHFVFHDRTVLEMFKSNQSTPTDKGQKMAKTMYDNHLSGQASEGNQKATPIFMLEDAHLENIIRVKAKNFCLTRAKFSDAPRASDPMVSAMGSTQAWDAQTVQKKTKEFLEDFQAYVCEAAVRGGTILAQASESLREVTKRESAIVIQDDVLMIEQEEEVPGF